MSKKALPLSSVFPGAWLWKSKCKEYNMKTNIRFLIMASLVLATAVFAQQNGKWIDPEKILKVAIQQNFTIKNMEA